MISDGEDSGMSSNNSLSDGLNESLFSIVKVRVKQKYICVMSLSHHRNVSLTTESNLKDLKKLPSM